MYGHTGAYRVCLFGQTPIVKGIVKGIVAMSKCKHGNMESDCHWCITSGCWAIVKNAKMLRESGHDAAVRWARAYLGLDDQETVIATRHPHDPEGDVNA